MKKKKKQDNFAKPPLSQSITKVNATRQGGSFNVFQHLLPVLLISILSLAIYANTLKNGFVYDDEYTIVNNTMIKDIYNLPELFVKEDYLSKSGETSYRPVVTLSYFLDYALYGLKPWGFHLTNILLHAANGIILYMLLLFFINPSDIMASSLDNKPLTGAVFSNIPLMITLLFASHPVLTEAVNGISYREDLLAFMFYMITLILYLNLTSRRPHHSLIIYTLSCFAYWLALLSKESAATLPLIVYCYNLIYGNSKNKRDWHSILLDRFNLGYIAITLFYLYLNFVYFRNPSTETPESWGNVFERLLTSPWLLLSYIKLVLTPVSLSADYTFSLIKTISSRNFIIPFITVSSFLIIIFCLRNQKKGMALGFFFFLITLMPVSNIIPIFNPLAERHLYLPLVGITLFVGSFITMTWEQAKKSATQNVIILLVLFGILIIDSVAIIKRNTIWRSEFSLWSDTSKKMPSSARAHYCLGNSYIKMNRVEDAIQEYKIAIKLRPNYFEAYDALGIVFSDGGNFDEAVKMFKEALRLKPEYNDAHYHLGLAYARQGKSDEAALEFQKAAKFKTNDSDVDVHNSMGIDYANRGMLDEAMTEFKSALKLKPTDPYAHGNLGNIYAAKEQYNEAMIEFKTAISLKPDEPRYHYNLGNVYHVLGQLDQAANQYQITLSLNSDFVEAHYSLGIVYAKKGLKDAAIKELEMALKLKPDFTPATQVLESLKHSQT